VCPSSGHELLARPKCYVICACVCVCLCVLQERYYTSIIDLVCLAMLLSITTSVRESASAVARSDIRGLCIIYIFLSKMCKSSMLVV
jgi:hypothetical protein